MTQNWKALLTYHCGTTAQPLVVILGPTASGKTECSLLIAQELRAQNRGVEIVNADSRQLYRFLDIGTAKITEDERRNIPHHMIDVLDPKEEATAAWYKEEATKAVRTILNCRNVPILVGGSMLYISAIIDDLQFVDSADAELRKRLAEEYDRDGGKRLYQKLLEIDPETAAGFHPNNKPYLIRAMEIYESTGDRPSQAKEKGSCPWNLLIFGMDVPREQLHQRIDARIESMFEHGWVDEVRSLLDRGYTADDPGMKSVGYREIAEAINSEFRIQNSELQKAIVAKTRQYAKRQMTWWRADNRIVWLGAIQSNV